MSDQRVVVHGVDEFQRAAAKLDDALEHAAAESAASAAEGLAQAARSTTPRLTGRLAAAIVVEPTDDGALVTYGRGVPYAGWIEFGGTRGRPYVAQGRYFGPAIDTAARDYASTTEKATDRAIGDLPWPK